MRIPRTLTASAAPIALLCLAAALIAATTASPLAGAEPGASVVRVNVTNQSYSFRLPWQKEQPGSSRALGALIADQRILVPAQVIADAVFIELEKPESGDKVPATVVGVDYEANLAVLSPAEDAAAFFEGMVPLAIDVDAKINDPLDIWQFEPNGRSVTTTVTLQHFELANYFLENSAFLVYEATGNVQFRDSIGALPVIRDGKLTGILLRYNSDSQVSEILPGTIIEHFLNDLANPPYQGFPNFGIKYARTQDEQLREFAKMGERTNGIYVSGVLPGTSAEAAGIKLGDVLLEIAGHPVDSRGNYEDPKYGILSIAHLVKGNVSAGDTINVKLLRDGQEMELPVTLIRKDPEDYLIAPYMFDRGPNYLLLGGLLFQELSLPYLSSIGENWRNRAPFKLVYASSNPEVYEEQGRRKLVFLSGALPTPSTLGYERLGSLLVLKVNGRDINDLKDLDEALASPNDQGIHTIEFDDFPKVIYVDAAAAQRDNEEYLPARYRIFQLKRIE